VNAAPTPVAGVYYDGRSARRHVVALAIAGNELHLRGDGIDRRIALADVDFGEALGKGPRCIELPEDARCEVADHTGFARLCTAAHRGERLVERLQRRWRWAAAALAIVVAGAAAGYLWGLPALAKALAPHVPAALTTRLSTSVLAQLDEKLLRPSRLPAARQDELRRLAERQLQRPGMPPWRIHFRHSPQLGANALALPGGDIIVLDGLIELMAEDRRVVAVVAHEIGHLAHRHAMQQLIQGTVVSLALAAWFGDVSSLAVVLSGQILQSGYSRAAEREADRYAAGLLQACCGSAAALVEALEALERLAKSGRGEGKSLFDTHPDTAARIDAVRALGEVDRHQQGRRE